MLMLSANQTIGNTPLLKLSRIKEKYNLKSDIYAKLEFLNPAGSIKDRVAKEIISSAKQKGKINSDTTIIEATSGNTGISLAFFCACIGLKLVIFMPDTMSGERISLMKSYGAEVILTYGDLGMSGAVNEAKKLTKIIKNSFYANQFENPANITAHLKSTGPEIYKDLDNIDYFVAGIGTGGTITGIGRYLKSVLPKIRIVGIEPDNSPVLTRGISGNHAIQGIGAGFVPPLLDRAILDEIKTVSDSDAIKFAQELSSVEGCCAGISSGANICACIKMAQKSEGKVFVTVLPDNSYRYFSTGLFI